MCYYYYFFFVDRKSQKWPPELNKIHKTFMLTSVTFEIRCIPLEELRAWDMRYDWCLKWNIDCLSIRKLPPPPPPFSIFKVIYVYQSLVFCIVVCLPLFVLTFWSGELLSSIYVRRRHHLLITFHISIFFPVNTLSIKKTNRWQEYLLVTKISKEQTFEVNQTVGGKFKQNCQVKNKNKWKTNILYPFSRIYIIVLLYKSLPFYTFIFFLWFSSRQTLFPHIKGKLNGLNKFAWINDIN